MERKGTESTYYVNDGSYAEPDWIEILGAKDADVNPNIEDYDVTTRNNGRAGNKAHIAGIHDLTVGMKLLIDPDDSAYALIRAAIDGGTTVEVMRVEGGTIATDGLDATRMICNVFGGAENEPVSGMAEISLELKFAKNANTDGPERGTTLSGDFVEAS